MNILFLSSTGILPEDFSIILTLKSTSNKATLFTIHGEGPSQLTVNVGKRPALQYADYKGKPGVDESPKFGDSFSLNDGE